MVTALAAASRRSEISTVIQTRHWRSPWGQVMTRAGGFNRGAIHVLFLNASGGVESSTKIASDLNGGPTLADNDRFGISATSLGDLNGDGVTEWPSAQL